MNRLNGNAAKRPESGQKRLARLKSRRKLWLDVHLWLGLVLGLFLSVFGLTGSILVFHQEIDEWINPALLTVEPPAGAVYKPLDEIFQAGQQIMGENAKLGFGDYPRNDRVAFKLSFQAPPAEPGVIENWQVFVNPYTAQILGKRLANVSDNPVPKIFIGVIFKLHYALLLPEFGDEAVGILGCLLMFSVLTGLIVWWPLTGQWRKALTIKRRASGERFNHDLHKTFLSKNRPSDWTWPLWHVF
jgi:uncharacterized iron-regulated membrane protein